MSITEVQNRLVAEKGTGFIHLVSVTGITGARNDLPSGLDKFVAKVRKAANQPLCIGDSAYLLQSRQVS